LPTHRAGGPVPIHFGLSLNNNPTVQDLWNSTPAFGFPFAASNAVVSPLAATAIDGTFAQSIAGVSAYIFWKESLYAEVGGYRSAQQGTTNELTGQAGPLDGTASNVVSGLAPYWRAAYEHSWGPNSLEVGMYGMQIKLYPGGTPDAPAPLSGPQNRFNDVAEDLQYQYVTDEHQITVAGTHIHESQTLDASYAAGASANPSDNLSTSRLWATYYYRRRLGGTVEYFSTTGSTDSGLYPATAPGDPGVVTSASGSPDTSGWMAEVNYLPWLNVKLSAQYTWYSKFNGGSTNYDGVGRNAIRQQCAVSPAVDRLLRITPCAISTSLECSAAWPPCCWPVLGPRRSPTPAPRRSTQPRGPTQKPLRSPCAARVTGRAATIPNRNSLSWRVRTPTTSRRSSRRFTPRRAAIQTPSATCGAWPASSTTGPSVPWRPITRRRSPR
jgi:hypothetical protein